MREDNPATEVMNSLAECLNACAILCLLPTEARRDAILDAVSWFVEAAPLNDLPTVWMVGDVSKDMLRDGAAVAARVKTAVLAWDGATPPPQSLASLTREFLVTIGMERILESPAQRIIEHDEWQDQVMALQTNFGHGLALLMVLAGRNPVKVSREEMLDLFAAFEAAYGPLAERQAEGRFDMGGGILSPELREQVTHLGVLLRLPPESTEAEGAAAEIRALAEECLRALEAAPPGERTIRAHIE